MKDKDIDFSKDIDFEVVGNLKSAITEILGYYLTEMGSDCDLHLVGTGISLPAYWRYLTYRSWICREIDEKIVKALLAKKVIKFHAYH